jgi:thiol:disulfide interchange protein
MWPSPSFSSRTPIYVWVLMIVPVGLVVGWVVAQIPSPKPGEKIVVTAKAPGSGTDAAPVATGAMSSASGAGPSPGSAAGAAPESAKPAKDEEPPVVSDWSSYTDALAESQRTGKPIMVDFSAEWCGPCQAMKGQLFEDTAMEHDIRTAVIPVSIPDRTREDGSNTPEVEELMRKYQVEAFPTLIVVSPRTGRSEKTVGYGGAVRTLAWIKESAASVR